MLQMCLEGKEWSEIAFQRGFSWMWCTDFCYGVSYIHSELFTASLTIVYRETENQVSSLLSAVATQWFKEPVRGIWGGTWKQMSETSVKNVYLYINNLSNSFLSVSVCLVYLKLLIFILFNQKSVGRYLMSF